MENTPTCEVCRKRDILRRNHIISPRLWELGKDNPSNIVHVCRGCEYKIKMVYGLSPIDYLPKGKLDIFMELPKASLYIRLCEAEKEQAKAMSLVRSIREEIRGV